MSKTETIDWLQAGKYLLKLVFVPSGRINPKQFVACAALFIFGIYFVFTRDKDSNFVWQILNMYFTYTIFGKRLHDIGRSSKIVVGYILASAAISLIGASMMVNSFMNSGSSGFGGTLLTLLPIAWIGWGYFLYRQETQPVVNRYGPPPLSDLLAGMPGRELPESTQVRDIAPSEQAPVEATEPVVPNTAANPQSNEEQ